MTGLETVIILNSVAMVANTIVIFVSGRIIINVVDPNAKIH